MKILRAFLIALVASSPAVFGDARLQCPINPTPESLLTEQRMLEMDKCMKDKSCAISNFGSICPWAFDRREKLKKDPATSDLKSLVEETCAQCEQLQKISCIYDFRRASKEFLSIAKIFVADNEEKKPLIFGYPKPTPSINNLNLVANMNKLSEFNEAYRNDLAALTSKLRPLSLNVQTQDQVRANIKTARDLISKFEQKWGQFHDDTYQMTEMVNNLAGYMADWQARMEYMQKDPICSPLAEKISLAIKDGSDFLTKIENANRTLSGMDLGKRTRLMDEFVIKSIKYSYAQASKKPLEDLEASLGAVLLLDQEVMKSNLWWIELKRGGLIAGLHTNYYQFESAMQKLIAAAGEGQQFLDKIKSIKGLSANVMNTAIRNQQLRIEEIQDDLDWLRNRGWEGQFKSQKDSASNMLAVQKNRDGLCYQNLQSFLNKTRSIDDYARFHEIAEAHYMQTVKLCEAGL